MALNSWYQNQKGGWFEERTSTNGGMAYSVYIPPNGVNSNTQIHVFSCNPTDYNKGWLSYVKQKQAENPNCIFMVVPSIQDGNKTAGAADFFAGRLLDITNAYNIPTTNINMYNWSNGNKGSAAISNALNAKGYTIGKYVSVFGIFTSGHISNHVDNFETGKTSDFPYIFIDDGSTSKSYLKQHCKDYIIIKVNNPDSHSFYKADNKFNLIDFFLNGEDFKGNVTITRYVNGVAQNMSYDEFITLMNNSSIEALYDKYKDGNLSDFAQFFEGGPGDTLASNLSYVSNSMSSIKSQITEHKDINYTPSADNEAAIIGTLYKASNYYGAVTNVLYGNLSAEADAVYGIANAIFKLDGVASVIAETSLSDGMKSLYSTGNSSVNTELEKLNKATSELYDTAKNAVMASGRYNELSGILGTKAESGSVGKISIGALESAITAIVPNLNSEVEKANGLKSTVDDFMSGIGSSNILQGGVWEDVKKNMENYHNLLDCNAKAAEYMSEMVKAAMEHVVKYIQDASDEISAVSKGKYGNLASIDELDDTKLPELTTAIDEVEKNITELKNKITEMENATHQECNTCDDGKGGTTPCDCHEVHDFTEEDIAPFRTQLTEAETLKKELDAYKGVLEGLAPRVQEAQEMINEAIDTVKNCYENPVTDTEGNQSFNADFNLDLSKYGIENAKDYAKLIDEYYDKLNPPKATIDDVLAKDAAEPDPAGTVDDTPYSGPSGTPSSPSTPSTPTVPETPTTPVTEPTTEKPTETSTEKPTESVTEAPTEKVTETPTETPTESHEDEIVVPATETQTEVKTEGNDEPVVEQTSNNGGKTNKKPKNPNVDPLEKPTEGEVINTQDGIEDTPAFEEPVIDDYTEPEIPTEVVLDEIIPEDEIVKSQPKNNGLKAMGIAAGVGLAVGAAALGAHTMMKKSEEDDEYDDYGYEK